MSGSGVTGALVRTTIIFGAIFFLTSLGLTTISTNRDSGGLTDIERALEEDFAPDPADDALGIGDLDDILAPDRSLIGNDPLAVDVAPVPADDTETPEDDPLGSAQ
jgi:preprotein translocase subunit SecG